MIPTLVGSRCRDATTGAFIEIERCESMLQWIDIGPTVRQFLRFSFSTSPKLEKGSEMALVELNKVASTIPNIGGTGSVMPSKFETGRSAVIGGIHNHPPGSGIGLSNADAFWARFQANSLPYRRPFLMVAVQQSDRQHWRMVDSVDYTPPAKLPKVRGTVSILNFSVFPIVAASIPPGSTDELRKLYGTKSHDWGPNKRGQGKDGNIQATKEVGITMWEWRANEAMLVPNPFFKKRRRST